MKPEIVARHRAEFLAKNADVIERRRRGESTKAISKALGVSHQRISQILIKVGDPALLGMRVFHRVERIGKTCPSCGKTFMVTPGTAGRVVCSRACADSNLKSVLRARWRCIEVGEVIVRRRIAGETWQAIVVSYGRKPNQLPYFHNNARRYLEHVGAPAETWKIVFPGQGCRRTPEWIAKIVATRRANRPAA